MSSGGASANSKEAFVCTSCGMDHSKVGAGWVLVIIMVLFCTHRGSESLQLASVAMGARRVGLIALTVFRL